MVKIVVLIRRKAGLTPEQFQAHYESTHANLALQYIRPYLLEYRRTYPRSSFSYWDAVETSTTVKREDGFNYDCITEMWFDDRSKLDAMFAKLAEPAVRKAIAEDEDRFIDSKSVVVITAEECRSVV